jgi:hypothetical protein
MCTICCDIRNFCVLSTHVILSMNNGYFLQVSGMETVFPSAVGNECVFEAFAIGDNFEMRLLTSQCQTVFD